MKLNLVVSDIHGNLDALQAVITEVERRVSVLSMTEETRLDKIIVLGDIVDYGAESVAVLRYFEFLRKFKGYKIVSICGNHDYNILNDKCSFRTDHAIKNFQMTRDEIYKNREAHNILREMTKDQIKEFYVPMQCFGRGQCHKVTLVHGTLKNPLMGDLGPVEVIKQKENYFTFRRDIILCGHSHIQGASFDKETNSVIINPGSVGQPRNGDSRAQYVLCNEGFDEFWFHRVEYNSFSAIDKIRKSGRPDFLSTRLFFGI